jgi:DNA-binding GntR family transcriptional regulator
LSTAYHARRPEGWSAIDNPITHATRRGARAGRLAAGDGSRIARFEKPTTLAVEIARHLREAIIRGQIRAGERLNESKLTRELALSRSPVREALRILEAEGLVTVEPRRGAHVRTRSGGDLREIFDVRLMFETHALERGGVPLTPETLRPLRDAVDEARAALARNALEPWHLASLRFHDGLVALAGNRHLERLYEDLKISLRWFQISLTGVPGQSQRFQAEHEAILAALEGGEAERGRDLVAEHVTNLKDALLTAIARRAEPGGLA